MRKITLIIGISLWLGITTLSNQPSSPITKSRSSAAISYYTGQFNSTVSSLPPNFTGHDLSKIYSLLKSRQETLNRGEFEEISVFEERIKIEKTKPLIGKLTLNDLFVFTIAPKFVKYDIVQRDFNIDLDDSVTSKIESSVMNLEQIAGKKVSIDKLSTVKYSNGQSIAWQIVQTGEKFILTYLFNGDIKSKTFGQEKIEGVTNKIKIKELMLNEWRLKVNKDDLELCRLKRPLPYDIEGSVVKCFDNHYGAPRGTAMTFIQMEPAKASIIKNDIRFLVAGNIVMPYTSELSASSTPISKSPTSNVVNTFTIHLRPVMTAFYNLGTGEIIERRQFEKSKQTNVDK